MEHRWYVLQTLSGHEARVKGLIELALRDNTRLADKVSEVLLPQEKVFEVKDGKKKSKIRSFLPGYILICVDLDAQVKDFINNTPSVIGFLGGKNPAPLREDEVKRIVGRVKQEDDSERLDTVFRTGDTVKIIDGPFNNFSGTVEEVNEERMKIKVLVSIFGRKTPVEIDFVQAELAH
jgi:transcriptional antiterminator NusG